MCLQETKNASTKSDESDCKLRKEKPSTTIIRQRRQKRDRAGSVVIQHKETIFQKKKKSRSLQKHANDYASGGIEALAPSLVGLVVLGFIIMGQMGFRGRATTAGIDLGTTNSVICVQAPSKGVGEITCITDPNTNSSILPSVVSFLEGREIPKKKKDSKCLLEPHLSPPPAHVVVGQEAKYRIDSHPHQTVYHAKRMLGRSIDDPAVVAMRKEVEFQISSSKRQEEGDSHNDARIEVIHEKNEISLAPSQIGAYIVHYMMDLAANQLGHGNVQSAVICVPAKFTPEQRAETAKAFRQAGVKVTRVLEEPAAAALAYGLHQKDGVEYILVYDFGGGTLDVSLLHVTEGFADVMGSDGDELLGGADFDVATAQLLAKQVNVEAVSQSLKILSDSFVQQQDLPKDFELEEELLTHCPKLKETPLCTVSSLHTIGEKLKIELSASNGQPVISSCFVPTNDALEMVSVAKFCDSIEEVDLTITLSAFNEAAAPLLERSVLPIRRLLQDLTLSAEEVDEVVMVGGTTRMPQIRQLVQEELKVESLNTHIDPDLTVAYGAASVID
mmetsp:Transcript_26515/g.40137  ORF Transcript_26515/g.40137 Transcript_26515/m.40137 type:complete len:559 (+) Transcript_26515:58-1734(+)|eukprot:CAMPEP_0178915544 /NCGR_PEP_ID=MMETSP0786-20121207/12083_1 /TAXON_ID=186022 /ORGANISM="Thalassionema frauenfeldii, Strain CCMP 1798" /LENGTH=558 /DNA_ID=CAMNT_0020588661 /DNA_START=25 /DNA_END=1701 /DNA_ORIENTATION=+